MAHKRPGVFKGQVRGVSHQGQENTLHLKAEYIDADFPSFETFPLHSHGGPYIAFTRRTIHCIHTADHTLSKFALHVSGPGELGENSAFREGQLLSRITGFWGGKLEESDGIRWVPV